ncbi:hypothetical protein BH10PSE17_BH10PSE17_06690 [soil metagenome]
MNQPTCRLSCVVLMCSVLAVSMLAGCSKQQEASRQTGKAAVDAIKAPIDKARDVERQQEQAAEEARKKIDQATQ